MTAQLEGMPAVVTTYFLRDNSLAENDLRRWADYVATEWKKHAEAEGYMRLLGLDSTFVQQP